LFSLYRAASRLFTSTNVTLCMCIYVGGVWV
jgi:hypothetical protein